ncbi:hypothetical protein ACG92U_11705 [Leuconostoc citreum]
MDMKISEAGITNREFTYEDIWKDTEDKEYALYSFKADKQVIGKTALPLNAPWVEEKWEGLHPKMMLKTKSLCYR